MARCPSSKRGVHGLHAFITFHSPARRDFLTTAISVVLFLLTLPGGQRVFALDGERGLSQYSLRVWQTRDGLPQNTIQTLLQTRDGYIWLGTLEGLVRFDGVRFQTLASRSGCKPQPDAHKRFESSYLRQAFDKVRASENQWCEKRKVSLHL